MLKKIFKSHKIKALIFYPIYFISKFIKRDKKIWLFAPMNHAFLDNSKYLFLHVLQNNPEIKAFFITENKKLLDFLKKKNLPVISKWSIKGFYYGLKAQFYIISAYIDDINYWTSGGAIIFNLWHGIPLKKIEFDIKTGPLAKRFRNPKLYTKIFKPYFYKKPHFVLSTSEITTTLFSSAFRIPLQNCPILGYPRTDIFFKSKAKLLEHINKFEPSYLNKLIFFTQQFSKVLIYMPTWRDDHYNFLNAAFPDIQELNQILKKQNALLVLKLHPNDNSLKTFQEKSNIKILQAKFDIYPFLPFTDVLITDYSSIYFDYLLLKKPIIMYPFDLDNYLKMRELYFNYEDFVPEPIVKTFNGFLKTIENLDQLTIGGKYLNLYKKFWKYPDGNSSKRIVNFLLNKNLEF